MKKLFLSLTLILFWLSGLSAEGYEFYSLIVPQIYNYESGDSILEQLEQRLEEAEDQFDGQQLRIVQSEGWQLYSLVQYRLEQKKEARDSIEISLNQARQAMEISPDIYSYLRVIDASAFYGIINGVPTLISMRNELNNDIEKAMGLDPDNPRLVLQSSQQMIFAPRLFGGNPEEAARILKKNEERLDQLSEMLRFETLSSLAQCWMKLKEETKALDYAEKALAIYPGNLEMQNIEKELN